MAVAPTTVSVAVDGGPTASVPWSAGMNAQDALELAFDQINSTEKFTFSLQFYGKTLGYLVVMLNETYDTFISSSKPYFYWEFFVNGKPSDTGIDGTKLDAGDAVAFSFVTFDPTTLGSSHLLRAKYESQTKGHAA